MTHFSVSGWLNIINEVAGVGKQAEKLLKNYGISVGDHIKIVGSVYYAHNHTFEEGVLEEIEFVVDAILEFNGYVKLIADDYGNLEKPDVYGDGPVYIPEGGWKQLRKIK